MRALLAILAFVALVAGCSASSPVAPEDTGELTGSCSAQQQYPC